jgi:ABC-type Fe3+-siderophore transport system permease subunit
MKRLLLLAAGFAYMVLLIEAIRAAVAWWRGDLAQPGWDDIVLLGLLPVLAVGLVAPHFALSAATARNASSHPSTATPAVAESPHREPSPSDFREP